MVRGGGGGIWREYRIDWPLGKWELEIHSQVNEIDNGTESLSCCLFEACLTDSDLVEIVLFAISTGAEERSAEPPGSRCTGFIRRRYMRHRTVWCLTARTTSGQTADSAILARPGFTRGGGGGAPN